MIDEYAPRAKRVGAFGMLLFVLASACSTPQPPTDSVPLQVDPSLSGPRTEVAPPVPQAVPEPVAELAQPVIAQPVIAQPVIAQPVIAQPVIERPVIAIAPPAKAPVKAAPVPQPQPPRQETPPPAAKAVEPSLDLASLQSRLRDTKAIGIMTKITLKNQVDDLMKQFRAHYQGGQKTPVAALRPPYDMLVLKVLAVVQDGDPALARTIAGSREAIWAILADRDKFNSVA
jgi:hypothetical protein